MRVLRIAEVLLLFIELTSVSLPSFSSLGLVLPLAPLPTLDERRPPTRVISNERCSFLEVVLRLRLRREGWRRKEGGEFDRGTVRRGMSGGGVVLENERLSKVRRRDAASTELLLEERIVRDAHPRAKELVGREGGENKKESLSAARRIRFVHLPIRLRKESQRNSPS